MEKVFSEAVAQLRDGMPVVVATVVRTKGSTPQKPGAKLLVRNDGSGVGTLGGGCVEGDIWFAAKELMKNGGGPQHRDYKLNEDMAAQDGLVCGGTMYFLIDPVYSPENYLSYATEIDQAYRGGPAVALASLIKPAPERQQSVGAKLFIRSDGSNHGTLGDKTLDLQTIERAHDLMIKGRNEYVTSNEGDECFIEAFTTPPQLVLCGGGHVSQSIAPLAKTLGFNVFVTDDREEFANKDRFPNADIVVALKPEEALQQLPINPNTFIIIVTRGHRYDNVALEAAVNTNANYVGLMGSKRKTILIYEDLLRKGIPINRVKEVRSPVGLDIHARTPEEIAVSIMSEILMFRLGGTGLPMKLDDHRIDKIANNLEVEDPVPTIP